MRPLRGTLGEGDDLRGSGLNLWTVSGETAWCSLETCLIGTWREPYPSTMGSAVLSECRSRAVWLNSSTVALVTSHCCFLDSDHGVNELCGEGKGLGR